MAMAGYSGTPLVQKLGIKPGHEVAVIGAPPMFALEGVMPRTSARGRNDVIVAFFTERSALARRLPALGRALVVDGGLWVAWPKRASGVPTDITEDTVRELALPTGLVDNKVCAIDDIWSGLRLVLRKELRAGRATAL